jgi:arylsulfatase A-like enzyme
VKTDVTVGLIDTYKILIDLCGLPENESIDGESLLPIFADPQTAADRFVITTDYDSYSIVNRDWRYIFRPEGEELYDLRKDPHEWTNLAASPEYTERKQELGAAIPGNPAPAAKGSKRKEIRLVYEGEDFRWIPTDGKGKKKP